MRISRSRWGRNPEVDSHVDRRSNATHRSTTDPEAMPAKKGWGRDARLCFGAHMLMDNREGLAVGLRLAPADGTLQRDTVLEILSGVVGNGRITVGADRDYDTRAFVGECRSLKVTPHVARKRHSPIDGRTNRHDGTASDSGCTNRLRRYSVGSRRWVEDLGCGTTGYPAIGCVRS